MKRFAPLVLVAVCLLVVSCTDAGVSIETTPAGIASITSASPGLSTTTSTAAIPTLTFGEQVEPPEFTEFTASTACDPNAEDANLQVIEAFVTAYNDRDVGRLVELVGDSVPVADMSGIPHLGEDDWTGVIDWANEGWKVDDRFELTRLVMYDSGSVFEVDRSNDVLRAAGIETLRHSWKVQSFHCSISRMVLYLPSKDAGEPLCQFWDAFADDLAEGTTQSIQKPEACSD